MTTSNRTKGAKTNQKESSPKNATANDDGAEPGISSGARRSTAIQKSPLLSELFREHRQLVQKHMSKVADHSYDSLSANCDFLECAISFGNKLRASKLNHRDRQYTRIMAEAVFQTGWDLLQAYAKRRPRKVQP